MDELKKLYDVLARDGYYTKSLEEFQNQFSNPSYQDKVFSVVSRDGLYTKSKEEFLNKYAPTQSKKKEESDLPSEDETTLSAIPGVGEVSLSGFTRGSRYDEAPVGATQEEQEAAQIQREEQAVPVVGQEMVDQYTPEDFDPVEERDFERRVEDEEYEIEQEKKEIEDLNKDKYSLYQQKYYLDKEKEERGEEAVRNDPVYLEKEKALINDYNALREKSKKIQRKQVKVKLQRSLQGSDIGAIYNQLLEGISDAREGGVNALTGLAVEAFIGPEDLAKAKGYKQTVIERAKEKGYYDRIKLLLDRGSDLSPENIKDVIGENRYDDLFAYLKDRIKKTKKASNKEVFNQIRNEMRDLFGSGTTKEYEDAFAKTLIGRSLQGAARTIPNLITPGGPLSSAFRVSQMYLSGTNALDDIMNNLEAFDDISENERLLVKAPLGVIVAVLEEYGFRNILKNSGVMNRLVMNVLGKATKSATPKTLGALVRNEVDSMVARGLITATGGALAEFETGVLQGVADLGVKNLYNYIKDEELFTTTDEKGNKKSLPWITDGSFYEEIFMSGVEEAIGGLALGAPNAISAAFRKKGFEGFSDKEFALFSLMSQDNNLESAYIASLKSKVSNGEMTMDAAKEQLNEYRNARGLFSKIPQDLSIKGQKKAMNLLIERQQIQKEIEGKDESLTKKQRDRIQEINQNLENLSEDAVQEQSTDEVPVQPDATVSEEVEEGVPETEPEVATEEGKKEEELNFQEATEEDLASDEVIDLKGDTVGDVIGVVKDDSGKVTAVQIENDKTGEVTVNKAEAVAEVKPIEEGKQKFAEQSTKVKKALESLNQKIDFLHFENAEDAENWIRNNYGDAFADNYSKNKERKRGTYLKNPSTGQKLIIINDSIARENTAAHEAFHVILEEALGTSPEAFDTFTSDVKTALTERGFNDIADSIDSFAKKYKDKNIQLEEFSVEFSSKILQALSTTDPTQLNEQDKSLLKRIGELLQKIVGKVGLLKESDPTNVLEYLKGLSETIQEGGDITQFIEPQFNSPGDVSGTSIVEQNDMADIEKAEAKTNMPSFSSLKRFAKENGYNLEKLSNLIKESKGAVMFVTSDGTKLGIYNDVKAGIEWIEADRTFGTSSEAVLRQQLQTARNVAEQRDALLKDSEKGKHPVLILTVTQTANALKGETYVGNYLGEAFQYLVENNIMSKEEIISEIRSLSSEKATDTELFDSAEDLERRIENAKKSISNTRRIDSNLARTTLSSLERHLEILLNIQNPKDAVNAYANAFELNDFSTPEGRNKIQKALEPIGFNSRTYITSKLIRRTGKGDTINLAKALFNNDFSEEDFFEKTMQEDLLSIYFNYNEDVSSIKGFATNFALLDPYKNIEEALEDADKNKKEDALFGLSAKSIRSGFLAKVVETDVAFPNTGYLEQSLIDRYNKDNGTNLKKGMPIIERQKVAKWSRENNVKGLYPMTQSTATSVQIGDVVADAIEEEAMSDEVISRLDEAHDEIAKSSGTTQRSNTVKSYKKLADRISKDIDGVKKIYDYGAGLGLGVDVMRDKFGDIQIDSFEPNTENWKGKEKPTYVENEKDNKTRNYDAIVSLNVLNVVPKKQRDAILNNIFMRLKKGGGKAYVSARGFKGDISLSKNFEKGPEEKSYILETRGEKVFQKGFDGDELFNYVTEHYKKLDPTGKYISVEKDNSFGNKGVVITKGVKEDTKRPRMTAAEEIAAMDRRAKRQADAARMLKGMKPTPKKQDIDIYAFPMPFGKYKGQPYNTIPKGYVNWVRENVKTFNAANEASKYKKQMDAKGEVVSREQRASVENLPGYERMQNELDGVIKKARRRGADKERVYDDALAYLQGSKVYEEADDTSREQMVRNLNKKLGVKERRIAKAFATRRDTKKVTVNEKTALKDLIRAEAKAARDAISARKAVVAAVKTELDTLFKRGLLTTRQMRAVLNRALSLNFFNADHVNKFVDYIERVYNNAEYADNLKKAESIKRKIKRAIKNKDIQAETRDIAKKFLGIEPFFVEDLNEYLEIADSIFNATSTTVGRVTEEGPAVSFKQAMSYDKVIEYTEKALETQEKIKKQQLLDKNIELVESGVLDPKMSLEEMNEIIRALAEDEGNLPSAEKQKMIRDFVKKYYDTYKAVLNDILKNKVDPFTGEIVDISKEQESLVRRFLNIDIDTLSLKDAYKIVESIDNFIVNQNTDGMLGSIQAYEGANNAKIAKSKGMKARRLRAIFSKAFGRTWAEQIEQLPMVISRMFGEKTGAAFDKLSGLSELLAVKNKAFTKYNRYVEQYSKSFGKIKDFNSLENIFSRGMLAYVSRASQGTEAQQLAEFKKRKNNVKVSIAAMKKNGTDKQKKEAEVLGKIYDELLAESNSPKEVASKSKDFNRKAVSFWQAGFNDIFDDLQSVSRGVYNTILDKDFKYTPDVYSRFGSIRDAEMSVEDIMNSSAFFGINDKFDTKESGSIMKATKPELQENPSRIVSFDFDSNMARSMQSALVDIETAPLIRKVDAFYKSQEVRDIIEEDDLQVLRRKIASYIRATKRKDFQRVDELGKAARAINYISTFAAARALGSLAQIPKQTVSVAFNTIINSGGRLPLMDVIQAKEFIDKSGYAIGLRGIASQADIQSMNKILKRAEESKGMKALNALKQLNEFYLEKFVAKPDVFIARASWLAYYKQELSRMGVDTKGIDWSTHKLNKDAADYAQRKVDRQQNYSDADLAGELLRNKAPIVALLRKTIFPFATFMLNKRSVLIGDVATLSNELASKEDKKSAGLSLASNAVEMALFHKLSLFIGTTIYGVLAEALAGDDEEDEKKKAERELKGKMFRVKNVVNEYISPIPNITDNAVDDAINSLLEITGVDEKYRLPEGYKEDFSSKIGMINIPAQKLTTAYEIANVAAKGSVEYRGKERSFSKEDKEAMRAVAAIYGMYAVGALPADAGTIANKAYYIILNKYKKGSSKKKSPFTISF